MTPTPEQEPKPPRVAIVIVTNRGKAELERCLAALQGADSIVVVDNGSGATEDLDERFPKVRFSRIPRDFGLTKGLNVGIRAINEAEFVLLLSPEVEIGAAAVGQLADTLAQNTGAGAVCPRLLLPGGEPADQVEDLPTPAQPNPTARPARPGETVPATLGQAVMLRLFFLRALRHIDERYGQYGGALELSQQVRRANKTILIHPTVTATVYPFETPGGSTLESDRIVGTAGFLWKHYGLFAGLLYWLKNLFAALFSFRLARFAALASFKKIDGS